MVPRRRRIYAQALTVGALLAAAGVELYGTQQKPEPVDVNVYKPHEPHPHEPHQRR